MTVTTCVLGLDWSEDSEEEDGDVGKLMSYQCQRLQQKHFEERYSHPLVQGCSNLSLEGQSAPEFSSNPDQTHLPVIF